jgi:hypothetical protein
MHGAGVALDRYTHGIELIGSLASDSEPLSRAWIAPEPVGRRDPMRSIGTPIEVGQDIDWLSNNNIASALRVSTTKRH